MNNGLAVNLAQEIRELSDKKSKLQTSISRLTSDKTKLELAVSKYSSLLKTSEEELAKIASKQQATAEDITKQQKELERIIEQIKVKSAQSDAIDAQIKMKQNQAKAEMKAFVDTTIKETQTKCAKLLEEAELSHKQLLEEAMQIKTDASVEAEETVKSATEVAETRKREANHYYDTKIAKADKEYQDILQKASEKHGEKIQNAITELAELNDKLSNTRLAIETATKDQMEALNCLQSLEELTSAKREELDSLSILILDKENLLGTHTKTDNKELVETVQNLQNIINELSSEKEMLASQLESITKANEQAIKEISEAYEAQIQSLKEQLEEGVSHVYEAEKESLKLEYELSITELNTKLSEVKEALQKQLSDTSKDTEIMALNDKITQLEEKLSTVNLEAEAKAELETKLEQLTKELLAKDTEIHNYIQENKSLRINNKDYADTKERFKTLNSDYNVAVTNQTSIANKVIELLVTTGIEALAIVYASNFASGVAVYIGWFIALLAFANTLFVGYKVHTVLSTAKEMEESMLQ